VGASLPPEKVLEFDQALAHLLATRFPGEMLEVPHRVFAVIAHAPDAVSKAPAVPAP
jgi:hypothetical protein